jgi:hypothetical protein
MSEKSLEEIYVSRVRSNYGISTVIVFNDALEAVADEAIKRASSTITDEQIEECIASINKKRRKSNLILLNPGQVCDVRTSIKSHFQNFNSGLEQFDGASAHEASSSPTNHFSKMGDTKVQSKQAEFLTQPNMGAVSVPPEIDCHFCDGTGKQSTLDENATSTSFEDYFECVRKKQSIEVWAQMTPKLKYAMRQAWTEIAKGKMVKTHQLCELAKDCELAIKLNCEQIENLGGALATWVESDRIISEALGPRRMPYVTTRDAVLQLICDFKKLNGGKL